MRKKETIVTGEEPFDAPEWRTDDGINFGAIGAMCQRTNTRRDQSETAAGQTSGRIRFKTGGPKASMDGSMLLGWETMVTPLLHV